MSIYSAQDIYYNVNIITYYVNAKKGGVCGVVCVLCGVCVCCYNVLGCVFYPSAVSTSKMTAELSFL